MPPKRVPCLVAKVRAVREGVSAEASRSQFAEDKCQSLPSQPRFQPWGGQP